jgi:ankyrin repeat protein
MPSLPEHASLEYLKKLAKDHLKELRRAQPETQLAAALLAVAREHGFPSWRALKAEVERRQMDTVAQFFDACARGDLSRASALLDQEPSLVDAGNPKAHYTGWTALHDAARAGNLPVVRFLLERGARPNAREAGDNTYPLHWAAARGPVGVVQALVDGGGDVHGFGDVHELDVIGWATVFSTRDGEPAGFTPVRLEVTAFLVERGARHHIFSAIALGDLDLIQRVVEADPSALDRRMSRFERGQSAIQFAIGRKRYDILDMLISLGADVEAVDMSGRTALGDAMLRGDEDAMRRLHAAGAHPPQATAVPDLRAAMADLADHVKKGVPMIYVADVAAALDWYASIGFTELSRFADDGQVNFGMVSFGGAELMLTIGGGVRDHDVTIWLYTDAIDRVYEVLKSRQIAVGRAALAGTTPLPPAIRFEQDIEEMFYGVRQFSIRDLNGYELYFIQPLTRT